MWGGFFHPFFWGWWGCDGANEVNTAGEEKKNIDPKRSQKHHNKA